MVWNSTILCVWIKVIHLKESISLLTIGVELLLFPDVSLSVDIATIIFHALIKRAGYYHRIEDSQTVE